MTQTTDNPLLAAMMKPGALKTLLLHCQMMPDVAASVLKISMADIKRYANDASMPEDLASTCCDLFAREIQRRRMVELRAAFAAGDASKTETGERILAYLDQRIADLCVVPA